MQEKGIKKRGQRGIVLMMIFLILAILTSLTVFYISMSQQEVSTSKRAVDLLRAKFVAESGAEYAQTEIQNTLATLPFTSLYTVLPPDGSQSLPSAWAYPREQFFDKNLNGRWDPSGGDTMLPGDDLNGNGNYDPTIDLNKAREVSFQQTSVLLKELGDPNSIQAGVSGYVGEGTYDPRGDFYSLKVLDAQSEININDVVTYDDNGNPTNMLQPGIIDMLNTIGDEVVLGSGQTINEAHPGKKLGERIASMRTWGGFATESELMSDKYTTDDRLTPEEYGDIKDFITIINWIDERVLNPLKLKPFGDEQYIPTTLAGPNVRWYPGEPTTQVGPPILGLLPPIPGLQILPPQGSLLTGNGGPGDGGIHGCTPQNMMACTGCTELQCIDNQWQCVQKTQPTCGLCESVVCGGSSWVCQAIPGCGADLGVGRGVGRGIDVGRGGGVGGGIGVGRGGGVGGGIGVGRGGGVGGKNAGNVVDRADRNAGRNAGGNTGSSSSMDSDRGSGGGQYSNGRWLEPSGGGLQKQKENDKKSSSGNSGSSMGGPGLPDGMLMPTKLLRLFGQAPPPQGNQNNNNGNAPLGEDYLNTLFNSSSAWTVPEPPKLIQKGQIGIVNEPRSPININAAPREVLIAVLKGIQGYYIDSSRTATSPGLQQLTNPITMAQAARLADHIRAYRIRQPFFKWSQWDKFIRGLSSADQFAPVPIPGGLDPTLGFLTPEQKEMIRVNANPNSELAAFNPDPVFGNDYEHGIDKSHLTVWTTEFCFSSMGYFEIESLGRVTKLAPNGYDRIVIAQMKLVEVVKEWHVLRQALQREYETYTQSNQIFNDLFGAHPLVFNTHPVFSNTQTYPENVANSQLSANYGGYLQVKPFPIPIRDGGSSLAFQADLSQGYEPEVTQVQDPSNPAGWAGTVDEGRSLIDPGCTKNLAGVPGCQGLGLGVYPEDRLPSSLTQSSLTPEGLFLHRTKRFLYQYLQNLYNQYGNTQQSTDEYIRYPSGVAGQTWQPVLPQNQPTTQASSPPLVQSPPPPGLPPVQPPANGSNIRDNAADGNSGDAAARAEAAAERAAARAAAAAERAAARAAAAAERAAARAAAAAERAAERAAAAAERAAARAAAAERAAAARAERAARDSGGGRGGGPGLPDGMLFQTCGASHFGGGGSCKL